MKTQHQQGAIRRHRGLIVLTAGAFLAAAFLTTGCSNARTSARTSGLQPGLAALPDNSRTDVTAIRHGDNPVVPEAMTAEHNRWRSRVGVPDLRWSDELADVAQNWADTLKEDGCGFYHSTGSKYGENLLMSSARIYSDGRRDLVDVSPRDAVDSWGNEVKDYTYATNSCSGVCGHYTQVVWKDTQEVGCARAVCDDKSQIWVCNYYPAGNYVGKKPY